MQPEIVCAQTGGQSRIAKEKRQRRRESVEEEWLREKGGEPKHPGVVKCPFTKNLVKV